MLELLERIRTPHRARLAGPDDLEAVVGLAFAEGQEEGWEVTAATVDSLRKHYRALLGSEHAAVFLLEIDGRAVGRVVCARTMPEAWNGTPTGVAWGLYTSPEVRGSPRAAAALLKAATEQGLAWGVLHWRVSIPADRERLLVRYEQSFGFARESVEYTYLLRREG